MDLKPSFKHARALREHFACDPYRPRYHYAAPEALFNDANGMLYHNGRYHVFYLARSPIPDPDKPGEERWVETWDHISSRDMIHWALHAPALLPPQDGSMPRGVWSGDAIADAPQPTLIYYVPEQGICVATSDDPDLDIWTPLAENPVVPIPDEPAEYDLFDPCAWYDGTQYFALVGNRNRRPGYEGDCTSLFRSPDLKQWEYLGPFYKPDPDRTPHDEDCACPDFYPLGKKHMLLMHSHLPSFHAHYYMGRMDGMTFVPERHGNISWTGGQLAAPETLEAPDKRRIMLGWVMEARKGTDWNFGGNGWGSMMSLPRELVQDDRYGLLMQPVRELEMLRERRQTSPAIPLAPGDDAAVPGISGNVLELQAELQSRGAQQYGIKVCCSPDREEETVITYDTETKTLAIDVSRSSRDRESDYLFTKGHRPQLGIELPATEAHMARQELPLPLDTDEPLRLRIFIDRSVIEVFANDRICLTQRMYPCRADSTGVRVFAENGSMTAGPFSAWELARVLPWP